MFSETYIDAYAQRKANEHYRTYRDHVIARIDPDYHAKMHSFECVNKVNKELEEVIRRYLGAIRNEKERFIKRQKQSSLTIYESHEIKDLLEKEKEQLFQLEKLKSKSREEVENSNKIKKAMDFEMIKRGYDSKYFNELWKKNYKYYYDLMAQSKYSDSKQSLDLYRDLKNLTADYYTLKGLNLKKEGASAGFSAIISSKDPSISKNAPQGRFMIKTSPGDVKLFSQMESIYADMLNDLNIKTLKLTRLSFDLFKDRYDIGKIKGGLTVSEFKYNLTQDKAPFLKIDAIILRHGISLKNFIAHPLNERRMFFTELVREYEKLGEITKKQRGGAFTSEERYLMLQKEIFKAVICCLALGMYDIRDNIICDSDKNITVLDPGYTGLFSKAEVFETDQYTKILQESKNPEVKSWGDKIEKQRKFIKDFVLPRYHNENNGVEQERFVQSVFDRDKEGRIYKVNIERLEKTPCYPSLSPYLQGKTDNTRKLEGPNGTSIIPPSRAI